MQKKFASLELMSNLDYGVIGNCQIVALVDKEASIDWLCIPRFDSPSIFAKILDKEKGGHFSIRPATSNYKSYQHYIPNTNILVTEFDCGDEGKFEVIDFIPRFRLYERYFKPIAIYRKIKSIQGSPRIIIDCNPKFNYALDEAKIKIGSNHISYSETLRLSTDASLTYILEKRAFKLDQDLYCILTYDESLNAPLKSTYEEFYEKTKEYWIEWVKKTRIPAIYQDEVIRAALALKLHCFNDTGAIIAAATTSIPEFHNSTRNWDYRYCWFRDAYFTMKALDDLGHFTEKEKFVSYLSNLLSMDIDADHLQPLYGISGEKKLTELELEHLDGFLGNKPVRIGNDAYTHKQYDLYGEMVLCLAPIFFDQRLIISYDLKKLFADFRILVEKSISLFNKPDAGIWEFRSTQDIHTFTQVFCWVAAYRGSKVAYTLGYKDLAEKWLVKAQEMKETILTKAWSEEKQMFTQRFNGVHPDASNLLMATLGIIEKTDPRFISTVKRYGELLRKGDYIFRYVNEDDFGFQEVGFNICTFWYIDALIDIGELAEAKKLYENMLSKRNHVGLLSEDTDPETGELWGNYPQTYSLVGIINSAIKLTNAYGYSLLDNA